MAYQGPVYGLSRDCMLKVCLRKINAEYKHVKQVGTVESRVPQFAERTAALLTCMLTKCAYSGYCATGDILWNFK